MSYWQEQRQLERTPVTYHGSSFLEVPDHPMHMNLAAGAAGLPMEYGQEPVYDAAAFPAFEPPQGNSYLVCGPTSTFNTVRHSDPNPYHDDNSFNGLDPSYDIPIPGWNNSSTLQNRAERPVSTGDFYSTAPSQLPSIDSNRGYSSERLAAASTDSNVYYLKTHPDNWEIDGPSGRIANFLPDDIDPSYGYSERPAEASAASTAFSANANADNWKNSTVWTYSRE